MFSSLLNKFYVLISYDEIIYVYGVLKVFVVDLMKIVNDVRWFVSGFCCGIGEIVIFENELGSFIMSGKVNLI